MTETAPEAILTQWVEVEGPTGTYQLPPQRRLRRLRVNVTVTILDEDVIDMNLVGSVLGDETMGFEATESSRLTTVEAQVEHQARSALMAAVAQARATFHEEELLDSPAE